jgi:hypothetical protein
VSTTKRYRVTLPIDVDGRTYQYGDIAELEMETAIDYAHALIALNDNDGREHGGNE